MNVVQELLPGREGNDFKPEECEWKRDWVRDEGPDHLVISAGRGLALVQMETRAHSRALTTSSEGKKVKWKITQAGLNFLSAWRYPDNPPEEEVLASIAARTHVKISKKRELEVEEVRINKKHNKVEVFQTKTARATARVPVLRLAVVSTMGTPMSRLLDVSKEELQGRFVHTTFLHFCARHKHNSYIIYNVDLD
jgi:hypothetical protein